MYLGLLALFRLHFFVIGCLRFFLLFGMFRLVRSFPMFHAGRLACSVSCFSVVVFVVLNVSGCVSLLFLPLS